MKGPQQSLLQTTYQFYSQHSLIMTKDFIYHIHNHKHGLHHSETKKHLHFCHAYNRDRSTSLAFKLMTKQSFSEKDSIVLTTNIVFKKSTEKFTRKRLRIKL